MSRLEDAFAVQLTALFQQHGWSLGAMTREYQFAPPRKWRADFAIYRWCRFPHRNIPVEHEDRRPNDLLLIEIEGGTRSGGRHSRHDGYTQDCIKGNAANGLGYTVLRGTSQMVTDGSLLMMVEQVLLGEVNVEDWKVA